MKTVAISFTVIRLALGEIESGNNDNAVGKSGEVSRYQVAVSTWALFGKGLSPRLECKAWIVAQDVLKARMAWPEVPDNLDYRGIYALWHRPGTFLHKHYRFDRLPKRIRARCERFANLCERYAKEGK